MRMNLVIFLISALIAQNIFADGRDDTKSQTWVEVAIDTSWTCLKVIEYSFYPAIGFAAFFAFTPPGQQIYLAYWAQRLQKAGSMPGG